MNNYAVIFTYSFDDEVEVYLFDTEPEAVKFLLESFKKEIYIDTEENGWSTESFISKDGWYARITNNFDDRDDPVDITEFRIGHVYSKES